MNNVAGGSVAMRVRMRCRHSEDGGEEGGGEGRTASGRGERGQQGTGCGHARSRDFITAAGECHAILDSR